MAARKKNATPANGPHSAAHTAAPPPPVPSAAPPADGPAAAVWATLTAVPGATAAQIATAAGTSRIVAGQELAALETSGLATRTPGARNGRATAPATWQPTPLAAPPAPATAPAGPGETEPAGTADPAAGSPALADGDASPPAPGSVPAPDEADSSTPDQAGAQSTVTEAPGTDETAPATAGDGAPGDDAVPDPGIPGDPAADGPAAGGNAASELAEGEPQPAPAREAAVLLREVASAAAQAAEVLDGGDTTAALAATDTICATAAHSRRLLKAAASGRKPRGATSQAARPGQLRDLVAAHLAANPDADFTPHAVGRVLGRSSGAVANALDRLTALGQAQLTSDKPRRYRHQAPASTPVPAGTT